MAGSISGSGLRYLPVEHNGNQNSSPEEAQALSTLVEDILESNVTWVDRDGQERPIALGDILIIFFKEQPLVRRNGLLTG